MGLSKPIYFDGKIRVGDPARWLVDTNDGFAFDKLGWLSITTGIKNYIDWLHSEDHK